MILYESWANVMDIESKINLLFCCIEEDGGIIDRAWCSELLYPYYKHFNDNNIRYRAGSIIAFWGLLLEWEDHSGFPFYREGFYTGAEEHECHHIDKYMEQYLKYSSDIKAQFPNIYSVIIESLLFLDKRDNFDKTFPNIHTAFFIKIRDSLLKGTTKLSNHMYKDALREASILI